MSELRSTREIAKVMTQTKVLAFVDKLREVPLERYGQIHANAETVNGSKVYSLIGITLDDHTKGKGPNTVKTSYNVEPELISYILSRLTAGFPEFKYEGSKIYGAPDANGRSRVDKITITRTPIDKQGRPYSNPWNILIVNGTGIPLKNNSTGGISIKPNSFVATSSAFIRLTDFLMFKCLTRVDSFIRVWEDMVGPGLIVNGRQMYNNVIREYKQRAQAANANPYPNSYAPNTGNTLQQPAPAGNIVYNPNTTPTTGHSVNQVANPQPYPASYYPAY